MGDTTEKKISHRSTNPDANQDYWARVTFYWQTAPAIFLTALTLLPITVLFASALSLCYFLVISIAMLVARILSLFPSIVDSAISRFLKRRLNQHKNHLNDLLSNMGTPKVRRKRKLLDKALRIFARIFKMISGTVGYLVSLALAICFFHLAMAAVCLFWTLTCLTIPMGMLTSALGSKDLFFSDENINTFIQDLNPSFETEKDAAHVEKIFNFVRVFFVLIAITLWLMHATLSTTWLLPGVLIPITVLAGLSLVKPVISFFQQSKSTSLNNIAMIMFYIGITLVTLNLTGSLTFIPLSVGLTTTSIGILRAFQCCPITRRSKQYLVLILSSSAALSASFGLLPVITYYIAAALFSIAIIDQVAEYREPIRQEKNARKESRKEEDKAIKDRTAYANDNEELLTPWRAQKRNRDAVLSTVKRFVKDINIAKPYDDINWMATYPNYHKCIPSNPSTMSDDMNQKLRRQDETQSIIVELSQFPPNALNQNLGEQCIDDETVKEAQKCIFSHEGKAIQSVINEWIKRQKKKNATNFPEDKVELETLYFSAHIPNLLLAEKQRIALELSSNQDFFKKLEPLFHELQLATTLAILEQELKILTSTIPILNTHPFKESLLALVENYRSTQKREGIAHQKTRAEQTKFAIDHQKALIKKSISNLTSMLNVAPASYHCPTPAFDLLGHTNDCCPPDEASRREAPQAEQGYCPTVTKGPDGREEWAF